MENKPGAIERKSAKRTSVSPTMLALAGSVIAAGSALLTAAAGGMLNLLIEREKQQFELLKQATTGLPLDQAVENLKFFVDIGYLKDPDGKIKKKAEEGKVPVFATSEARPINPLMDRLAELPAATVVPTLSEKRPYTVRNNILYGSALSYQPTQNFGSGTQLENPQLVILHATQSVGPGTIAALTHGAVNASAHLLITRDGNVYQLLPFDYVAFHAGNSRWGTVTGLNRHSLGIMFENGGSLQKRNGQWFALGSNIPIPESDVLEEKNPNGEGAVARQRFTAAQIQHAAEIIRELRQSYPSLVEVLGHSDVAQPPGSKIDPGPTFPIRQVRKDVFGHEEPMTSP